MKTYKILLSIPTYTGATDTVDSSADILTLQNNYYAYSTQTGQGGVVNNNNVRQFLDDDRNIATTTQFVTYLQSNMTNAQFKEIFYDNTKLADVFNAFYNDLTKSGNTTSNEIAIQLQNTTAVTISDNTTFNNNNTRMSGNEVIITSQDIEPSYYISFPINMAMKQVESGDYSQYSKNTIPTGYTYTRTSIINSHSSNISNQSITIPVYGEIPIPGFSALTVNSTTTYIDTSYRKKDKELWPQLMLNGFVDYNYDGNESEVWHN